MTPPRARRWTRLVLALGVVSGVGTAISLVLTAPEQVGLAADVYFYAAEAALAGEDFYAVAPPDAPGYRFLYPPILIVAFVPHALLGDPWLAYVLQTALNLAAAGGIVGVVFRGLDRRGVVLSRRDRALVAAFVLVSGWTVSQLVMGQTTLWLALAVAAGLDALERGRDRLAGSAFAIAALVKVFPAVLGLWLLRRRSWTGVAAAIATGLAGLGLGTLVFDPDVTVHYLTEVLLGRHERQAFDAVPAPDRNLATARRQVAVVVGGGSPLVPALAFAAVAPLVALCYRSIETDAHRLTAVVATIVGTLLVMPMQPLYFTLLYYPLVIALFVVPPGRARSLLLAGTAATFLRVKQDLVAVGVEPLPAAIADPILAVTAVVFSAILPPTIGTWLLLAGCAAWHLGEAGDAGGEPVGS